MNKITKLIERIGVDKKNIKPFLIFLVGIIVVSIFLVNTSFLSTVGPVMFTLVFGFFVLALSVMAGYAVFRSLLTASIGLSLIIFIGDEYCHLPVGQQVANNSLMTLIGIGFAYVVVQFIYSLFKEFFGDKEAKDEWRRKGIIAVFKEMNGNKHSWLVLVIYGLLIALFVSQIYNVINPIIHGLCVYK
jgi:hypothetical protein